MSNLRLQVRGPGNKVARLTLPLTTTYADLISAVKLQFPQLSSDFVLHYGVPPRIKDLPTDQPNELVTALGPRNGDTLIVEENPDGGEMVQGSGWTLPSTLDHRGRIVHYKVPGDNSCMFHAIGAAFLRQNPSAKLVTQLKAVIEAEILKSPKEWTIAQLGESPSSYIQSMKNPNFWGGAIELAILSAHYGVEISVVDYAALCVTTFAHYNDDNQNQSIYPRRVYLIYNGANLNAAHYDLLVATSESAKASVLSGMEAASAEKDTISAFDQSLQTIFRPTDEVALNGVKRLAETAHDRLVSEGKVTKRTWTEKDQIKKKNQKPAFTGGKGQLGETVNMGNHMALAPTTATPQPTTITAPVQEQPVKQPVQQPVAQPIAKPQPTTAPVTAPATATANKANWSCEACTYSNSYARTLCEMCESPRPAQAAVAAATTPAPKPQPVQTKPTVQPQQQQPQQQQPQQTTRIAPQRTTSEPDINPFPTVQPKTTAATPTRTPTATTVTNSNRPWTCASCTYANRPSVQNCEMCGDPKSGASTESASVTSKSAATPSRDTDLSNPANNRNRPQDKDKSDDGSWTCTKCQRHNQSNESKCPSCGEKKGDCSIM